MLSFKKLDTFLMGQLTLTIVFGVVLFSLVWLAPETLFKLIQYVFGKQVTLEQAATMLAYHMPAVLQQSIPMAVLIGAIFVFQRMSQNFELVACFAAGISPKRMLLPLLTVGLIFGALHVVVQEWLIPVTNPKLDSLYSQLDLKKTEDRNFVFVEKDASQKLSKFFMISKVRPNHLQDFVVLYYDNTNPSSVQISRILRAKSGEWEPQAKQWTLSDGIEYVLTPEGVYQDIRTFENQQVHTSTFAAKLLSYFHTNPQDMSWTKLSSYIDMLEAGNQRQEVPYFNVLLFQKLTAPLATVMFVLLGALLGIEKIRSNRSLGLTSGAVIIFIYSVMVPFSTNIGAALLWPPLLVALIPLTLVTLLSVLIYQARKLFA